MAVDIKTLIDAAEGSTRFHSFRKNETQSTSVAGFWFDWSMSAGNPSPQYYAATPLQSTVLARSTDGGLQHGANVSPLTKYLRKVQVVFANTAVLGTYRILDYLMFYSFVDQGTNDEQFMSNTSSLTRYTTGDGVQIMPVVVAPGGGVAGVTFVANYTNSSGASGRTTSTSTLASQTNVGICATSTGSGAAVAGAGGPFMRLQDGDRGVRSIESVTFTSGTDVGLLAFVLVKPLANFSMVDVTAPSEFDYITMYGGSMPIIKDDAYLNFIFCGPTILSTNSAIHGSIETMFT